ncbi:MAG: Asp23/Gls24 family envelope stress response protein [Oscillospiraceae bacterium]|jgi:uncharacterized alkaline shock family protein YloU|nr:Asp23/Gls24 family envelope stress response protein [Oscillospiraceae bacterium]
MSETKQSYVTSGDAGKVAISEDVIQKVAAAAARSVEGVAGLQPPHGRELLRTPADKRLFRGANVTITDEGVTVALSVVVRLGGEVGNTGAAVQEAVAAALDSVCGITPLAVNVRIAGIALR